MSDWIDKAKDFIKGHPEQAQQGLEKAEEVINERTGGKYADQVDKGADAVRGQLGLPDDETTQPPTPPTPPTPGPGPTPGPAPTPEPAPAPVPDPSPTPGPAPTPGTVPPVDPNDPSPVDPGLPGGPGPSEIPPGTEPGGEHDLPGGPHQSGAGAAEGTGNEGAGDITLGDPPRS